MRAGKGGKPKNFQSGTVSVPLKLIDETCNPPVEDMGKLVAGTIGFTVTLEEGNRAPVVEAKQGWVLFLPKGSPVIPRLKLKDPELQPVIMFPTTMDSSEHEFLKELNDDIPFKYETNPNIKF